MYNLSKHKRIDYNTPPDTDLKRHTHSNKSINKTRSIIDTCFNIAARAMIEEAKKYGDDNIKIFKQVLLKCPKDFQTWVRSNYIY